MAEQITTSSVIEVCIFGVGRAGTIHLKNLLTNPRARVIYIVEQDTKRADDLCATYRLEHTKVLAAADADTVFEDSSVGINFRRQNLTLKTIPALKGKVVVHCSPPAGYVYTQRALRGSENRATCVDAVLVCTPTLEHEHIVKKALHKGKAVFCEKPISDSISGIEKCYEAARQSSCPLVCSFNRRFDPSVQMLKQRLDAGELGKLYTIKTCSRDHPLPPYEFLRGSGGIFHDCGVHDIDMVCWLVGESPCSVYVQGATHDSTIAEMKDMDNVLIILKFPSSLISAIDLSRHATYGYDQRVEVFGAKGMLQSENHQTTNVVARDSQGSHGDAIKYSFPQRYADSYVIAMEHFLDVIQGKCTAAISSWDVVKCSKIADACEESAKTGLPVTLDLVEPKDADINGAV